MKKETPKEVQLRIAKLKWLTVKAIRSVGHPNDIVRQKCIRPTVNRIEELKISYQNKPAKERVWPSEKSGFQIVTGEKYEVREDFLAKVTFDKDKSELNWFETSKNKNK